MDFFIEHQYNFIYDKISLNCSLFSANELLIWEKYSTNVSIQTIGFSLKHCCNLVL